MAKKSIDKPTEGEAAAEWVSVEKLKPWAKNPRKNDAAVAKVMKSIKRFGFGAPLLARKQDGELIAGHTRLKAAIKLKIEKVPVRYLDLDPADAHLLALADNRVGEEAEWDEDELAEVLRELRAGEADLEDSGFSETELEKMLGAEGDAADEPDTSPQLDGLRFQLLIECVSEEQQAEMMGTIEALGISCKPLIV